MAEHSKPTWKRIGCAGMASAAAVTMGLSVHHEVQLTATFLAPGQTALQTSLYRQQQCIYRAVRDEVPKGATVYITSPPNAVPTERLSEVSTLWAVLEANPAAARWMLSLVPASGHCGGQEVEVHPR